MFHENSLSSFTSTPPKKAKLTSTSYKLSPAESTSATKSKRTYNKRVPKPPSTIQQGVNKLSNVIPFAFEPPVAELSTKSKKSDITGILK